jgi:hypothetical protein
LLQELLQEFLQEKLAEQRRLSELPQQSAMFGQAELA